MSTVQQQLKLEQTAQGWDRSAEGYLAFMEKTGFTRLYAQDILDETLPVSSQNNTPKDVKILDIAAGTGAMSIIAAQRVKALGVGGSVLATDFSPLMVECIEKEIKSHNLDNIKAQVMDGQNLTLADSSIDFAYIIFGIMFFPDQQRGLSELLRVLKPGGVTGIATWSPKNPMAEWVINTLKKLVPQPTTPTPATPTTPPTPTGITLSLSDPVSIETVLKSSGFVDIKVEGKEHCFESTVDMYVDCNLDNPVLVGIKNSLPQDKQPLFADTLRQVAKELHPNGIIKINSLAYLTTARKPQL
ncbi:putative SAM dependent methyltransferase [Cavenderia fasciculata]|uniref:SAM dependent methyltransferase n=1 Tax=Cavenderia fasciculata TaxID=261658 RepID=F4PYN7_CACFS|nr:putative SAM dependent methyltransferase [Cavenderia fasciculata]EGG19303.1 putative SAM dependent methyltransferase [Cavenderia fasciculata]|eukprot:XP_004357574.1 putative SAM dependent methyltransferase [Cavenderia fasciculata]